MTVPVDAVSAANYRDARGVYDRWFDAEHRGYAREAGWVRLVAALDTESKCKILAHGGGWSGGNRTNSAQRRELAKSARLYREATGREPDGVGNNGASVGPLQQIPTVAARLRTEGGIDGAAAKPWDGWGGVVECMVLETCIPPFLDRLRVTSNKHYGSKPMAGMVDGAEVVADLLRVQQPAEDEVAVNYGVEIVRRAFDIAAQFPRSNTTERDWLTMASKEEVKAAFAEALAEIGNVTVQGKPLYHYLVATLNSADEAKGLIDKPQDVLGVGDGVNFQSLAQAIAQIRNDVSAIKAKIGA